MVDNTLEEIVAVESELQSRYELEKRKAAEWLAAEEEKIARESKERLAAVRKKSCHIIAEVKQESGEEIGAVIREAELYEEFLRSLPDEVLGRYVRKHLAKILPEGDRS